jgi:hypothetical protein
MPDSLTELVAALDRNDAVPERWAQGSERGPDPVSVAWASSSSPWAMVQLLHQIRSSESERAAAAWLASAAEPGHPPADASQECGHCAGAVRAAIERPPTAVELSAATRERRAEAERAWVLGEDPIAMIEAAARAGVDPRRLGRSVCACARRAIERTPAVDPRTRRALAIAERWALGEEVTRPELYNASATAREVPATLPEEPLGVLTALAVAAAVEIAHTSAHLGTAPAALFGHAVDMAVEALTAGMRAQAGDRPAHAAAVECAHLVRAAIGELY